MRLNVSLGSFAVFFLSWQNNLTSALRQHACRMTNSSLERIIKDFSSYFNIKVNKLNFSFNKVPLLQVGKNEIQGLRNLVSQVGGSVSPEHAVVQEQWVEYVLMRIENLENVQVLKDINGYMEDKVYFTGNEMGPVDVLIYYLLYSVVLNLTMQEKEKYLHLSRWFNNIQQSKKTRLWRSHIFFSKTLLYV